MGNDFYSIFKRIIREGVCTTTYKMAWAKALVEISIENTIEEEVIEIQLKTIAEKFMKYYWNQTIFFDLVQGSNLTEIPEIIRIIKEDLIEEYYNSIGLRKPERFERIEKYLREGIGHKYNECLNKISRILRKDVSYRFIRVNGKEYTEIYKYNKGNDKLYILSSNLSILKEHSDDLFDIINYRWGMILEEFNTSPRINKKVKIIDGQEVRRKVLNSFKKYLDAENPKRICFICKEYIEESELSIDHVIPWSYLYSDDIWNLVYVHKSCNSIKSNIIPLEKDIIRLEKRNKRLLEKLKERDKNNKIIDELQLAIDNNYVRKFWINCM